MAEREYDTYDDWIASGGDPTYGQSVPTTPYYGPPTTPYQAPTTTTPTATPTATPTTTPTTTPNADPIGRNDPSKPPSVQYPGYQWVWEGTQWVSRPVPGSPTTYPTGSSGGSGSFSPTGFSWPDYTSPDYLDPGTFDPGQPFTFEDFSYKDFSAPTGETMLQEPGFQFRMDQGRKALEASAAGRGTLRSGGTLKDILQYGQNFASQEYGNVYNRALQEYDTNRDNAFGNYQSKRQNAWDTWNTGYGGRKDAYTFNADNLSRKNTFNQSNAQADFTGRQAQAMAQFQDMFNRWAKEGDWIVDAGRD